MSDHCKGCTYDYKIKTGEKACPFNSLYWNFLDNHRKKLENNPRMGMMYKVWDKMQANEKEKIILQAQKFFDEIKIL